MFSSEAMAKIFKAVGAVAGIGGIALTVLWSIYGQVINEHLLGKVSANLSGLLIGTVIILTFLIAILSLFVGFFKQEQIKPAWFLGLVAMLLLFFLFIVYFFLQSKTINNGEDGSLIIKGYKLFEKGDLEKADKIFDEAKIKQPYSSEPWYWKAEIALKLGNKDIALNFINSALHYNPEHSHSLILKIKILLLIGGEKISEAKILSQKYKNIEGIKSWIECLNLNNFFTKKWITETEINSRCFPPTYQWE